MTENKVRLDVFEGPLDLLLYLVKKEEVDIYQVNLTKIATQFIEYIEVMRQLDLEIAGEFLVMASTLMYIKSRELLPLDQQIQVEGEEDEEDPRWELIRQLVEYKKFKDAAAGLQEREAQQEKTYPRSPAKPEFVAAPPPPKPEVSLFDLINAVSTILKRFGAREEARDVYEDKWTVSEKIEWLMRLMNDRLRLKFSELFAETTSRSEVVVTFLALLELIRLKHLSVSQPEPFSEIEISRVLPSPRATSPAGKEPPAQHAADAESGLATSSSETGPSGLETTSPSATDAQLS
ncbi:MAG: segregation/condensation protein A [Chloroflexi bacterium]|nr:segregation/condensation protein A [Chloroflexota bacterium]